MLRTRRVPKSYRRIMENLRARIRPTRPSLSPIIEVPNENNSNYNTNNYISNSNNSAPGHNEGQLLAIMAAPRSGRPIAFRNVSTPAAAAAAAPQAIRPVAAPGGGGGGAGAFKPSFGSAFKKPGTGGARFSAKRRTHRSKKLKSRRRR